MARRSRRRFLQDAAVAAAGVTAVSCFPDVGGHWAKPRPGCQDSSPLPPVNGPSRVAEVHAESSVATDPVTRQNTVDPDVVRAMLDDALGALAGTAAYWPILLPDVTATTRVGIKVNTLNQECSTRPSLVRALVDSLRAAFGLPAANVIVWDRRLDELSRGGYSADAMGGVQVMGTVASTDDASGPGYEEAYCLASGKPTHLARILTELTDVTINCPVLKTHSISGVTAALKNIYGVIDNPSDFHGDLVTSLPALYRLPPVHERMRLTIVDALIAVTVGGTSSPVDTVPKRILAGQDALAVDSYALALVNRLRAEKAMGLGDVDGSLVSWLENARALGLGATSYDLVQRER